MIFIIWVIGVIFTFIGCFVARKYFGQYIDGMTAILSSVLWPATPIIILLMGFLWLRDSFDDIPVGNIISKQQEKKTS